MFYLFFWGFRGLGFRGLGVAPQPVPSTSSTEVQTSVHFVRSLWLCSGIKKGVNVGLYRSYIGVS